MHTASPMVQRKMFTVRLSEDEQARLDLVATHYGLTAAGVLRMLLKREEDAIRKSGAAPARKPKKK
jgi:antitoxin component of RelBE/YafQ-DinJ toxin-antitoxin module